MQQENPTKVREIAYRCHPTQFLVVSGNDGARESRVSCVHRKFNQSKLSFSFAPFGRNFNGQHRSPTQQDIQRYGEYSRRREGAWCWYQLTCKLHIPIIRLLKKHYTTTRAYLAPFSRKAHCGREQSHIYTIE